MLENQSRQTSGLFDSRIVPRSKGIGYPSCNTELALIPGNTQEPHGYYAEIGVAPDASRDTILARLRELFRMHHPDGRQVLQPTNSLAAALDAGADDQEAAGAELRDKLVEAAIAKNEAMGAGEPVPTDKRAV